MGSGFRTFASGEVLTSSNVQNYLMDQAVMVFAGTAARASALPSPEVGMTAYSTATGLQVYNGTAWVDVSTGYGVASGANSTATITVSGTSYTLLTFTSSGTLTVSKAGLFDVLLVGGGGGGGRRSSTNVGSGGGGGGAVIQQTIYLSANATVTVGAKGAAQTGLNSTGNPGTFSRVNQLCAGGGGGGMGDAAATLLYRNIDGAGSGGGSFGAVANGTEYTAGRALITVGANNGGEGGFTSNAAGGGGGGSTQAGQNNSGNNGGAGGTGTDVSTFIGGSALFHGAGGGGGSVGATGGTAGNSTGGNGGSSAAQGSNATATNYGCGGGGGATTQGGAGADGVVYVRFR